MSKSMMFCPVCGIERAHLLHEYATHIAITCLVCEHKASIAQSAKPPPMQWTFAFAWADQTPLTWRASGRVFETARHAATAAADWMEANADNDQLNIATKLVHIASK